MSPKPDDSHIDEMRAALQGDLERARTRLAAQTAAEPPVAAEAPAEVDAPAMTDEAPPAPLTEPSPGPHQGRLRRLLRPFR